MCLTKISFISFLTYLYHPHLLCNVNHSNNLPISSFYVSDNLSSTFSYYIGISSQSCFSHLLRNVFYPTSSCDLSTHNVCNDLPFISSFYIFLHPFISSFYIFSRRPRLGLRSLNNVCHQLASSYLFIS